MKLIKRKNILFLQNTNFADSSDQMLIGYNWVNKYNIFVLTNNFLNATCQLRIKKKNEMFPQVFLWTSGMSKI